MPQSPSEESVGADDDESIREFFSSHFIRFRSMSFPLRFLTGFALAQMLAALLILALDSSTWKEIPVFVFYTSVFAVPVPVLVATIVFIAVGWTFLIAGTTHAHPYLRPLGVLIFLTVVWQQRTVFDAGSAWKLGAGASLAAILLIVAWSVYFDRRAPSHRSRLKKHQEEINPVTIFSLFLCVLFLYLCAWLGKNPHPYSFGIALNSQLTLLAILLVPVLFLAGVDLTEMGYLLGEKISHLSFGVKRAWLPALLLVAVVAYFALTFTIPIVQTAVASSGPTRTEALLRIAMGVIVIALLWLCIWLLRRTRVPATFKIPYLAVVGLVAASYFVVALGLVLYPNPLHAQTLGQENALHSVSATGVRPAFSGASTLQSIELADNFTVYAQTGGAEYRIQYPTSWLVSHPDSPAITEFSGQVGTATGWFAVVPTAPSSAAISLPSARAAITRVQSSRIAVSSENFVPDGTWNTGRFTWDDGKYTGTIWTRIVGTHGWILFGSMTTSSFPSQSPVLDALTDSWTVGTDASAAPASQSSSITDVTYALLSNLTVDNETTALSRTSAIGAAALFAIALFLCGMMVVRENYRKKPAVVASAIFALFTATVIAINGSSSISLNSLEVEQGAFVLTDLTGRALPAISAAFSTVSGAWLLWMAIRGRVSEHNRAAISLVLCANLGLLAVSLPFGMFDEIRYGNLAIPPAIIILFAMMWDIALSGSSITNRHSSWLPRHARVLLYFAYIGITATLLLFYSTLTNPVTNTLYQPVFDSNFWPQQGVVDFGLPLVLTIFVVKVARWRARRAPGNGRGNVTVGPLGASNTWERS